MVVVVVVVVVEEEDGKFVNILSFLQRESDKKKIL